MGSPDATNDPKADTNPPKYGLLEWICLLAIVPVSLWLLFGEMDFEPEELFLTLLGMFLLWAPVALATFVVIRKELGSDLLSCFVLSVITSYGATTALYFFFSVLELWIPYARAGFLLLQCFLVVNLLARPALRHLLLSLFQAQAVPRIDSILIMILLAISLVNSRYKHLYHLDPRINAYRLTSDADQTYYTSMAYECSRGVPMRDAPYRTGIPPRAYHMFPHLTTALIGKVTGQTDLTRAHLMYEYTFIETMLTLAVFLHGSDLDEFTAHRLRFCRVDFSGLHSVPSAHREPLLALFLCFVMAASHQYDSTRALHKSAAIFFDRVDLWHLVRLYLDRKKCSNRESSMAYRGYGGSPGGGVDPLPNPDFSSSFACFRPLSSDLFPLVA